MCWRDWRRRTGRAFSPPGPPPRLWLGLLGWSSLNRAISARSAPACSSPPGGQGARCPKGSVYGRARAITPLLDEPLEGPVFLRSSSHKLPDLVLALKGSVYQPIEVVLDGRIDSVKGGIRATFEDVPDAPVSRVVVNMRGGKKGLIVNSTNLCKGKHRASVKLRGQNGKVYNTRPLVRAQCSGKKYKKKRKAKHRRHRRL